MNPFEELISVNEMSRSKSFDLINSGTSLFQPHTQISSVSNAIGYDPARMANFLGHQPLNNKVQYTLETIYENLPTCQQNFPSKISSNFHPNSNKEQQQSSDNKIISIRGSVSSWNL